MAASKFSTSSPLEPALRDFTSKEVADWKAEAGYGNAKCEKRAILLIGPAAAGKSYFRTTGSSYQWRSPSSASTSTVVMPGSVDTGTEAKSAASSSTGAAKKCHIETPCTSKDESRIIFAALQPPLLKISEFVDLDGDAMRNVHAEWSTRVKKKSGGARAEDHNQDLFEAMKPVVARLKDRTLKEGIREGRNFSLPLTFSTQANWDQVSLLQSADYRIARVLVFLAPFGEIQDRVALRGEVTGRKQSMSSAKYNQCLDGLLMISEKFPDAPVLIFNTSTKSSQQEGPNNRFGGSEHEQKNDVTTTISKKIRRTSTDRDSAKQVKTSDSCGSHSRRQMNHSKSSETSEGDAPQHATLLCELDNTRPGSTFKAKLEAIVQAFRTKTHLPYTAEGPPATTTSDVGSYAATCAF
ncbi:unnamed protein product [Amoebophrya sp. A25]|nr:unnamed protein product [Amoebophrya sp. A25]|eukprot:GSA25T00013721001.1